MPLWNFAVKAHVANGRRHLALGAALNIKGRIAMVLVRRLLVCVNEMKLCVILPLGDVHENKPPILHSQKFSPSLALCETLLRDM